MFIPLNNFIKIDINIKLYLITNKIMNMEEQLGELLSLLETSYSCKDSNKLQEISQLINGLSNNFDNYLELLFKGLSLSSFNNKQMTLNLHKSLAINIKNVIMEKMLTLKEEQILNLLQKIFILFFSEKINPNLLNESIINIFENIITSLSSIDSIKSQGENLFKLLTQAITSEPALSDNFINKAKIVVRFCKGLFESNIINKDNYAKIINDYYIIILDTIFNNISFYIEPNKELFNDEYISLLNYLIGDIFVNLRNVLKINMSENEEINKIIKVIFDKYGPIIFELIKIQFPFDDETKKIYNNQNSIIVYNSCEKKCFNINRMKSKCFQFFCFITEQLTVKIDNKTEKSYTLIKDKKLIEINAELIKLIVSSLQDVLNNKEKYNLIKNPRECLFSSEKSYNDLLFNMILLFLRSFTREPIKTEFLSHIKYFVLNILFPLVATTEEEKIFLKQEPDSYQLYLNDIINDFSFRNYRTAICYLLRKICINYIDMNNFILSYVIEMLIYTFKRDDTDYNCNIYNIYLDNENKSLINNFSDEIKIDFCFLILLLLKDNVVNHNLLKNKFISFFIENQDKIHQINSPLILIKICKIYNQYYAHIFKYLQNEKDVLVKSSFIEKTINILLNFIVNYDGKEIQEIIISEASDTILSLFKYSKDSDIKDLHFKEIIIEKFQLYFKNLIKLVNLVDNPSLNIIISYIIEQVYIKERNDVLNCLENFTKKFQIIVNTNYNEFNKDDEMKNKAIFINQYFILLENYLKGENKFTLTNKDEIIQFNNIISPIIIYISDPEKYAYNEEIVSIGQSYMIALNSINEASTFILDNLYQVINKEQIMSGVYCSFISTFLSFMTKNQKYNNYLDKIINIIKLSFSFPKETFLENFLSTLLLIMQILSLEVQIDYNIVKYFIIEMFKYYMNPNEKEFEDILILNERSLLEKTQQVLIASLSLIFIKYPDNSFKILKENLGEIYANSNISYDMNDLKEIIINLYSSLFNLKIPYYSLLGKCDILCLCSIIRNQSLFNTICVDKNSKILLLKLLINFTIRHKEESLKIQSKLTNSEIKCGFVHCDGSQDSQDSENEDLYNSDDSESVFDNSFYETIKNSLKDNIIIGIDEFKIFSETLYQIKNNDKNFFNELISVLDEKEKIKDLFFVRNVKIEYKGHNFEVPRKTLKIKRNAN